MKVSTWFVVALVACVMAGLGSLGCNTFKGAGKDIQNGGQAVENAAGNAQADKESHEAHPHAIMASAEAGGSIAPSGSVNVPYGSSQTFAVRAYTGYHVTDVLVDGKSVGAVSRYSFTKVTTSHTISASFGRNTSR